MVTLPRLPDLRVPAFVASDAYASAGRARSSFISRLCILRRGGFCAGTLVSGFVVVLSHVPAKVARRRVADAMHDQRTRLASGALETIDGPAALRVSLMVLGSLARRAGDLALFTVFDKILRTIRFSRRLLTRGNISIERQPLGVFQFTQHRALEASPVNGDLGHIVAVCLFLTSHQFSGVGSFRTIGWQHVDLGDQLAVRVHQDVDQVAVVPRSMFAATSLGIARAPRAVAVRGMILVRKNLVRQLAGLEEFLPRPVPLTPKRPRK